MADEYVLSAKITADSSGMETAVKKADSALENLKSAVSKATDRINEGAKSWGLDLEQFYNKGNSIFKDFGVDIDKFAAHFGTSGKVVAAITAASVALTKFGQSMNSARAEIAKGTGATGDDLIALQDTVHDALITGIGQDISTVGGMIADLNTRFGVVGETLVSMTNEFDMFSEVMGIDARSAINDVADVMSKWSIEVENLNPLLDQLTVAAQMSGATTQELLSGLKSGQSVFSQFGMSATDSIALLSSFAKNGIEVNTAVSAMRIALTNFSSAGKDAKTGLEETITAIQNAASETEALNVAVDVFGSKNGAEMVKVLQSGAMSADEFKTALLNAGGALADTDKASRTSVDAIEDLKSVLSGTFAGFGEGFDNIFKNIIDSFSEIVAYLSPVIEPIGDIFREVFTYIGELLKTLVDNFITFQEKYNIIFNGVATVLQTAYQAIHKILGNLLSVVQSTFGLIFAILDGKWSLAWEYAKKIALTFVDNIASILSSLVNLFAQMINGIIEKLNKAIDLYHKLPKSLQLFDISNINKISEAVNLSDAWGITDKLEEVNAKINELSGKTAEKLTGDLGKVKETSTNVAEGMKVDAMEVSETAIAWSDKILAQDIAILEKKKKNATEIATLEGKTEAEIYAIASEYDEKIKALKTEQLERERKAAIEKVQISEESAESQAQTIEKINLYYDRQIEMINKTATATVSANNKQTESTEKAVKSISEQWSEYWEQQKKELAENADDWTDVFDSVISAIGDVGTELFEDLGAALVEGGDAFEDFGETAVAAIAEVLEALAEQLAAMAAVKVLSYQYGQAAMAAAAAATALAAAGAMKAVANATSEAGDEAISTAAKINEVQEAIEELLETGATSSLTVAEQFAKVQTTIANAESALATAEADYKRALEYFQSIGTERYEAAERAWAEKAYKTQLSKYNSALEALSAATNAYNTLIEQTVTTLQSEYTATRSTIAAMKELYTTEKTITTSAYNLILQEQINGIQDILEDAYGNISSVGNEIGGAFIDSLMDGLDADGFASSLGDYVKELVLKMSIFTDDFMSTLGGKAADLASAIVSGNTSSIATVTSELKELYSQYEETYATTLETLDAIFAETEDSVDDSTSSVEESLTTLESAIESYQEEIADLGASVASELISSLSSSYELDEALESFKSFIRNYVIQAYVYTESLKSSIESIGDLISSALTDGLTTSNITTIKDTFSSLYSTIYSNITAIDSILDAVMPDIEETVEDTTEEVEETLTALEDAIESFSDSISDLGADVASQLISSLNSEETVDEAIESFKSFLREYIVQAYVYTNAMKSKIEAIGDLITNMLNGGSVSESNITTIANQIKKVYTELANSMEAVDSILDAVMPDIEETVEETTEEVEETLTAFEEAIESFEDTISDLGGDIASELISGLTDGLSDSDFLDSFKTYLKKLIIQSVVYTETLKSEIESIGTMIADGLANGFSETSLHEIRRDISYLFSSANSAISSIDTLLESVFSGYATGTQSATSGLHLVGEAGPELVQFKGGERVYNAHDTEKVLSGASSTSNSFNVTFNNVQDTSAYSMMRQLKAYNRQLAINGIF